MELGALGELQMRNRGANGRSHTITSCLLYHTPNGTLGLAALDDDTWTDSKELHSTSDDKIGPKEEDAFLN